MREIVNETETTGISPHKGDRIVELACIELIDRVATGRVFHSFFNPECSVSAGAEAVHGLSDAFLADKPLFHDRAEEILDFIGDSPLVAHNASFDFGFLNAELSRSNLPILGVERMIDTLALARARFPGAKHSIDALCTRYGVDRSKRIKHGALIDAELVSQIYVELTGGRRLGLLQSPQAAETAQALEETALALLRLRDLLGSAGRPNAYGGIGHNRSPESLQREHEAILDQGALAAAAASAELARPQPRFDILQLCYAALKQVLKLLRAIAKWTFDKGDRFANAATESAGKAVGPVILLTAAAQVARELAPAVEYLWKLLGH